MKCYSCGNELAAGVSFCSGCGAKVNAGAPPTQFTPPTPPPPYTPTPPPQYRPPVSPYAPPHMPPPYSQPKYMPHVPVAPGKNFLLVTGILITVFSVFNILSNLVGIFAADWFNEFAPMQGMSWGAFSFITLLVVFYDLFVGIMGIVNRERLEKAGMLKVLGIGYIAAMVIRAGLSAFVNNVAALGFFGFVGFLIGLGFSSILPIIYIVGANRNEKAAYYK